MNRTEIKNLFFQGLAGIAVLFLAFFILFTFAPILLALWATGLVMLFLMKRQNAEIVESRGYQIFQKLLYFQIINTIFAFFFVPIFNTLTLLTPVVILVLAVSKERRAKPEFVKWAKYVGFHCFNWLVLMVLIALFPNMGGEEALFGLSLITLINGAHGVFYLKLEQKLPPKRRFFVLVILAVMMVSMAISMFPQAGNISLFDALFRG